MGFGCGTTELAAPAPAAPEVTVASPVRREVVDYEYFTGRVEATEEVQLRARVSGHLTKVHFKPGTEVKQNDLLIEIDARPFQADLDRAVAEIAQAEAKLTRLTGTFNRVSQLRERGASTEEDFQVATGEKNEAAAQLESAKVAEGLARLNLEYCQLKAPLSGRIGDRLVDEGNLVTGSPAGATLLTSIVAVDPVEVPFGMDETTLQRLQQEVRDGRLEAQTEISVPVEIGLSIHKGEYPIPGTIWFVNNQVDPTTGTIMLKAQCANPMPETGGRLLTPGMFARVRIPVGKPRAALLVPESALGSEQGSRFLYLVDGQKKAVKLTAEIGLQDGDLREIISVSQAGQSEPRALTETDQVIVRGIQRVRSGIDVVPQQSN